MEIRMRKKWKMFEEIVSQLHWHLQWQQIEEQGLVLQYLIREPNRIVKNFLIVKI